MTRRRYPPFPATPPTTRLLRAVGDLQRRNPDDAPVSDMRALGRAAVMQSAALFAMIAHGVKMGYLEEDANAAVGLTTKGLRWYLRDLEQRE